MKTTELNFGACLGGAILGLFSLGLLSSPLVADDLTPRPTMGEILRFDAAADNLLPADAKLEVLASGLVNDGIKAARGSEGTPGGSQCTRLRRNTWRS